MLLRAWFEKLETLHCIARCWKLMVRDTVRMKGASYRRLMLLRLLVVAPALILFLYFAFLLALPSFDLRARGLPSRDPVVPLARNATGANASPLQDLHDALRSATSAAARFRSFSFNAKAWSKFNPCSARTELGPRYAQRPNAELLDPNPHWDLVLEEYIALHGACMRSIGNITEYFLSGATTSTCKFLIMEIGGVGLGNKVTLLTSAILYAVLTQRVLLVNSDSYIPWTMCEPFVGSSWILDQHFPLPGLHGWESTMLGRLVGWESHVWKSGAYFSRGIDAIKAGGDAPRTSVKIEFSEPEMTRFFCNTEQAFLTEATWLYSTGSLYFLPKLFAVPAFRPALEALFPDPSLTLTYLLRSLMLPKNAVWEQVKQHDKDLFADANRRVGIQVRFLFGKKVYFQEASKRANDHVKQCIAENIILPQIARNPGDLETDQPQSGNTTRVLITSLHTALTEDLQRTYENERTVKVTQLSHRQKQGFGTTEDHMAMVEILLLSFVDEMIVTPSSTFGGLAHAYGATIPWFVEVKGNEGSCVRAQTVDLCYQAAQLQYDCPHEPTIDRKDIRDIVPYMRRCLPIEESDGLQLVPPA